MREGKEEGVQVSQFCMERGVIIKGIHVCKVLCFSLNFSCMFWSSFKIQLKGGGQISRITVKEGSMRCSRVSMGLTRS